MNNFYLTVKVIAKKLFWGHTLRHNCFLFLQIKDSDAGWTLGYMLNLTNMIPAEAPDTPLMPHGGYVTFMLLFTLFILGLFLLAFLYFRKSTRKAQKGII